MDDVTEIAHCAADTPFVLQQIARRVQIRRDFPLLVSTFTLPGPLPMGAPLRIFDARRKPGDDISPVYAAPRGGTFSHAVYLDLSEPPVDALQYPTRIDGLNVGV